MSLQLPRNLKLPNTLDNPKVLELSVISKKLPQGTTLESLYQINDQSIWFLIWILKKNRFWSDLIREILEDPFEVKRQYRLSGRIEHLFTYKNDMRHSTNRTWYRNGQLKWEDHWKDNTQHGISCWWFDNGHLCEKEHWKDGKQDGIQYSWRENGQLYWEQHWKDGKILRIIEFGFGKIDN